MLFISVPQDLKGQPLCYGLDTRTLQPMHDLVPVSCEDVLVALLDAWLINNETTLIVECGEFITF